MLTKSLNGLHTEQLTSVQRRLAARRDATIYLIRRLVEIESPSGDLAGSRAVVDVLQEALSEIAVVDSIERIPAFQVKKESTLRATRRAPRCSL